MKDMFDVEIEIGNTVLKPERYGSSAAYITVRTVTNIKDGKIYLDDSKVAIQYPDRLVVFNKEE